MGIAGIVLSLISIGLIFKFKKERQVDIDLHQIELEHIRQGMNAVMDDFNNYQVSTDRKIAELEKALEIKAKNIDRKILKFKQDLPKDIRGVIGHIEFSQNNLR
jgi:hypothetical protein